MYAIWNLTLGKYIFFAIGNGADFWTQYEGSDSPVIDHNVFRILIHIPFICYSAKPKRYAFE